MFCCGQISGFGQLIRKFLGLKHPKELFCFKESRNKETGLIKIGLLTIRSSHLQAVQRHWARDGGKTLSLACGGPTWGRGVVLLMVPMVEAMC